jgi:peptide/nickel transport system permease protein
VIVYVVRRVMLAIITVLIASALIFAALLALPGDIARQILGRDATPQAVADLTARLHLDQTAWQRYLAWLNAALHGDFGTSLVSGLPVSEVVFTYLRNSGLIAGVVIVFGIVLSLVLGVIAGLNRGKPVDTAISIGGLLGMSIPEYTIATLLVMAFSIAIPIFPAVVTAGPDATVAELLPSIWLPVITLTVVMAAYIIRMTRSSVIDVMASEFVTTAQLKGLGTSRIVMRHVMPSAMLPVLNVIAINIAWLVGGVVVVEAVFNYPGLGTLLIDSVTRRDIPMLQLIGIIGAITYAVCNLAADLVGIAFNPRLRTLSQQKAG